MTDTPGTTQKVNVPLDPAIPVDVQVGASREVDAPPTPKPAMSPELTAALSKPKEVDTPSVVPVKKKLVDEDGDPSPDHPKWKKLYGEKKRLERELAKVSDDSTDTLKVISGIQEHNKRLQEALDLQEDRYLESIKPDPVEKPAEYAEWLTKSIERKVVKNTTPIDKPEGENTPPPPVEGLTILDTQIAVQESLHDDYDSMMELIKGDLEDDPALRNTIWADKNPPAAAYAYAVGRKKIADSGIANLAAQGYVEGGQLPYNPEAGGQLSPEQIKMADKLGVSHTDYATQLKVITERGR